jgi:hypothetical protein
MGWENWKWNFWVLGHIFLDFSAIFVESPCFDWDNMSALSNSSNLGAQQILLLFKEERVSYDFSF